MYMFTIDSTTYDETQLNMIQIEQLITKHRTLVGRIKKIKDIMKEIMI